MRAANTAAVDPAAAADQLMNFAERAYPLYFPSHQASVDLPPYRYRFYAGTGVYLGVADGVVYVMGGTFGGTPRAVGPLTAYITPVDIDAAVQLARAKACLACHAVDTRLIGPSFRSVSARYAGQPGAADLLVPRIIDGGVGVWGSVPMPPNFNLSLDEAKMLAAAILTL
jgi:cytochrome c